jgi:hypothetical protein
MENWKITGQGGNADDTGTVTESGEKEGEEDMKKEIGTISKKGNMDEIEEEDTATRS